MSVRLALLAERSASTFPRRDTADREAVPEGFAASGDATGIVHPAAQAGARYSLDNPYAYVETNIMGQVVMLEAARHLKRLEHFVCASSSSVCGRNTVVPFSDGHRADQQVSIFAASKKEGEMIAHTYSHLYQMPTTGLRFFKVYGPWGGGRTWRRCFSPMPS